MKDVEWFVCQLLEVLDTYGHVCVCWGLVQGRAPTEWILIGHRLFGE